MFATARHFAPRLVAMSAALLGAAPAWAQSASGYSGHHMWGDGWGGMGFGPVLGIILTVVLVFIVVYVLRWILPCARRPPAAARSALEILDERFARGEIDKDEYLERKRTLKES